MLLAYDLKMRETRENKLACTCTFLLFTARTRGRGATSAFREPTEARALNEAVAAAEESRILLGCRVLARHWLGNRCSRMATNPYYSVLYGTRTQYLNIIVDSQAIQFRWRISRKIRSGESSNGVIFVEHG